MGTVCGGDAECGMNGLPLVGLGRIAQQIRLYAIQSYLALLGGIDVAKKPVIGRGLPYAASGSVEDSNRLGPLAGHEIAKDLCKSTHSQTFFHRYGEPVFGGKGEKPNVV